MRIIGILLLILTLTSTIGNTQLAWAPPSAKWTYHGPGDLNSYIEIKYEKDSLILSETTKVLSKTLFTGNVEQEIVIETDLGFEITFEKDSVIYIYNKDHFDTLFSFSSSVGDKWLLHCYPFSGVCINNSIVSVKDTGTVKINSVSLRKLVIEYEFYPGYSYSFHVLDTIVERMGSINSYFLPWDILNRTNDGEEGGNFRCYSDDQIGEYSESLNPCNYLLSEEPSRYQEISISPNPAQGYVIVDLFNKEGNIKIYDINGRIIYNNPTDGYSKCINLKKFPRGFLLFIITDSNSEVYKRIIIN